MRIVYKVKPIPAELLEIHRNPVVPDTGSNGDLLNWAQSCALNAKAYENQILRLRELQ